MPQPVLQIGGRELRVLRVLVEVPVCGTDCIHLSLIPDVFDEADVERWLSLSFRAPHGKGQALCEKFGFVPDTVIGKVES